MVIGNGKDTKVWHERWIGAAPTSMVQAMRLQPGQEHDMISDEMKVSELMEANGRDWRPEMLERLFTEETMEKILKDKTSGSAGNMNHYLRAPPHLIRCGAGAGRVI